METQTAMEEKKTEVLNDSTMMKETPAAQTKNSTTANINRMKYYRSLGVNGTTTIVPNSLPNNTGAQMLGDRMRTHTIASTSTHLIKVPNRDTTVSPRKKRSTSTPIPITMPQPIPGRGMPNEDFEEEEEEYYYEEEEEEIDQDVEPSSFVPPHEMLARQNYGGFAVGTAHSVAVWEQKRRNLHMNV